MGRFLNGGWARGSIGYECHCNLQQFDQQFTLDEIKQPSLNSGAFLDNCPNSIGRHRKAQS